MINEKSSQLNKEQSEQYIKELKAKLAEANKTVEKYQVQYEGRAAGRAPTKEEIRKKVLIAPLIPENDQHHPHFHYEENLGNDIDASEAEITLHDMETKYRPETGINEIGRNYNIRGKRQNKVKGMSGGPRRNAGISLEFEKEWAPVAYDEYGNKGYILFHPFYFTIGDLFEAVDYGVYYEKHRKEIIKQEFYIGGHICIPIAFGDRMLQRIAKEAKTDAKYDE